MKPEEMFGMHKIWMVTNPLRLGTLAALGVVLIAAVIHFVVLSSPRYCDHLGWCASTPTFTPGQPVQRIPAPATR
jgi:hypothetical protein